MRARPFLNKDFLILRATCYDVEFYRVVFLETYFEFQMEMVLKMFLPLDNLIKICYKAGKKCLNPPKPVSDKYF